MTNPVVDPVSPARSRVPAEGGWLADHATANGYEHLWETVHKAWVFTDRSSPHRLVAPCPGECSTAMAQLAEWVRTAAGGDPGAFAKRLAFDELETASAVDFIMGCHPPADEPLPAWALAFHSGVVEARRLADVSQSVGARRQPIASFTEVWTGFVISARERLRAQVGPLYELLSREGHSALESGLAGMLAETSRPVLDLEFETFRSQSHSTAALLLETEPAVTEAAYLGHLSTGGMVELFREYPMLARLIGTVLVEWVDASAELIRRLEEDWPAIRRVFGLCDDRPAISTLECHNGDRHFGGRSVTVLSPASGTKLVYKPRNLGIETAYNEFIDWLNLRGLSLPLRNCRILDQGTHGWAEFIESEPPRDEQAHRNYCHRCGIVLCVAYLLRATDLHADNVVVAGEHPVLIDLETLLHPDARDFLPIQDEVSPTVAEEWNTVLRTGLLPPLRHRGKAAAWLNAGISRSLRNASDASGREWNAEACRKDVVEGFCQTYRILLRDRDILLGSATPLELFAGRKIRFIFRSTRTYACVLQEALRPRNLRNGVAYSISIEALSRIGGSFSVRPSFWPVIRTEQEALARLDIPHCTTFTDSTDLDASAGIRIRGFLAKPGLEDARERLHRFSLDDMDRQVRFITDALLAGWGAGIGSPEVPRATSQVTEPG